MYFIHILFQDSVVLDCRAAVGWKMLWAPVGTRELLWWRQDVLEGNGTSGGRAWWEADKVSVQSG